MKMIDVLNEVIVKPTVKEKKAHNKRLAQVEFFKKNKLQEVFLDYIETGFKANKKQYGILKNPTSNELRSLMKEEDVYGLRLIYDLKNKDLYVFNDNLLHQDAHKKIFGTPSDENHYSGYADRNNEIKGFKIRIINKELRKEKLEEIKKGILSKSHFFKFSKNNLELPRKK